MADRPGPLATVRARLTAMASLVTLLVLAAAALLVTRIHHGLLVENLDEQLEAAAAELAASAAAGQPLPTVAGFGDDDAAFQVLDADGEVVAATTNLAGAGPLAAPTDEDVTVTVDRLPHDDASFRVRAAPFDGGTVLVAASLDDVEESTTALGGALVVAVPVAAGVLALVLWVLTGRTLRPVEAIRAEVAGIGGGELHRRVPEPPGDDEVARLARTMNEMLGRLESSAEHQRRFVADASHELRSPLTRMRTELEVDAVHPRTADPAATRASVLEEVEGMQRTVEDLMLLARADAGVAAVAQTVALDEIVQAEWPHAVVEPVEVLGDAGGLRRVVRNLVDNARRHAAGAIAVELCDLGDVALLAVQDDGPGIPTAEHERVFERFTRLDEARSTAAGGTGLGLAIVKQVVEAHGGRVFVDPGVVDGTRLVVELPLPGVPRLGATSPGG